MVLAVSIFPKVLRVMWQKSLSDLITHIYQTKNLTFCQSKTCLSCAKGNLKFVSYEKLSLFWFYDSQNLASFSSQPFFDILPFIKTLMVSRVTVQQNKTWHKVRPGNRGKCVKKSDDHDFYSFAAIKISFHYFLSLHQAINSWKV